MISKIYRYFRAARTIFFNGPAVFNYPGKRITGYRSINVLTAYWLHAFSVLYFTRAGRVLSVAGAYFLLGSMLTLLMPIYFLSITLANLLVLNILLGWFVRPRLKIVRFIPESAPANTPVEVQYAIENTGSTTAWDIVVDAVPMQGALRFNKSRAFIRALNPKDKVNVTNELIAKRRGCHLLPQPVAASAFPFGLWRWSSRGMPNKPLAVYPDYAPLTSLRLPQDYSHHAAGNLSFSARSGQSMEFLGCREFRYGDNPRHIHAPSWARLRQPIVKEFSDEQARHVAIFVDTFAPPLSPWSKFLQRSNIAFEAAMSLAAATGEFLTRDEYRVELFTFDAAGIGKRTEPGREQLPDLMEAIAAMEPTLGDPPRDVPREFHAELENISLAVLILLGWDEQRQSLVREFMSIGLAVKAVCILEPAKTDGLPSGPIQRLRPQEILAGSVREF